MSLAKIAAMTMALMDDSARRHSPENSKPPKKSGKDRSKVKAARKQRNRK